MPVRQRKSLPSGMRNGQTLHRQRGLKTGRRDIPCNGAAMQCTTGSKEWLVTDPGAAEDRTREEDGELVRGGCR